jgi:ectoine hydroxylase-related dioxygenase (phytanoyl-CoA dioxygenase family)
MKDILVIDNIISEEMQNSIEGTLLSSGFPWYFMQDVTYSDKDGSPAFFHLFKDRTRTNSNFVDCLLPIINGAKEKVNFPHNVIYHARTFIQLPLNPNVLKAETDLLHIDTHIPHTVVLYYVCDSDGDTIIVNKKYDGIVNEKSLSEQNFETLAKVTPKKGRAVVFDGAYYHTAEQPTKSKRRCVINIDMVLDDTNI